MPDYDFTGLCPGSFEQLIQAIALKVVSPQTIIFGQGTDGGREASYRGKTDYPNEAEPWDGYIVLQAKFRQRPDNDTKKNGKWSKDGNWAVSQLKKELEDFANPKKGRRIPEYYIFVTNVVLTPMLDKGSKDKVYKLFEDYKDTVPIKSYDVWDYDKIVGFLDDNPGIRQTYAAWITPGDVLAKVIQHLEGLNRPDFETVISNFLQKELSSDLNANLEQAGNSKDDRIPLASVFVDLPFANRRILEASQNKEEAFIVAQLIDSAKQKLVPKFLCGNFPIDSGISWTEELRKQINSGRWVVIGGPGQGKTTVGQFLCQLFRVAILKDKTNINDPDVLRAISDFKSQCQKETIALPKVRRFPIRIILNDFAAKLASQETNSLLNYIVQRIRKRTDRDIVADYLRLWLATYPWLIILDGLDEVPASSNREEVLEAIRNFWIDASDENADIMVVATTRPQGYNEDFSTDSYNHVWLTPLSSEQALHYASRLVELRYGNNPSRQEKITSRLERAAQDDSTTRLMQSPLQVTIMTVLCDRLGQPPKERWKLFKAYYQVIYQREIERDIPASTLLREYQADIDSIHYQMGLLLQVESERFGKTDARLSVKDFTTLVRSRLLQRGHEGKECENLTKQIIEAAANRLVFLVGLEQDIVGFEIRSLQEFMASEAIMNGSDEQIRKRLDKIIPIISWRNVVLFAIGKCFANTDKEHLQESIYTKCSALNENDIYLYRASLAGSRLALDVLEDGVLAQQPKYLKLFTRLALNLLDLPPDNFHIQLADVYTESLKSIYQEEIAKRVSNSNYQQSLGAWTCLLQLINLGFDWAIELADRYWCQDQEEQLKTISCLLHSNTTIFDSQEWIASKINSIVPQISPVIANKCFSLYQDKLFDFKINDYVREFFSGLELTITDDWHSNIFLNYNFHPKFTNNTINNDIWALYYVPSILLIEDSDISLFSRDFLVELEVIPKINYYWIAYKYAMDFCFNPSKELLSKSLEYIAQHYSNELISWIKNLVSWQIYECLLTAENSQELLEIANLASQGELGDREDWLKAEERWNNLGITDKDFDYNPKQGIPFDANIATIGFPLKDNPWLMYHKGDKNNKYSENSISLLTNLLNSYPKINCKYALITISDIIINLLPENRVKQEFIQNNQYKSYDIIKKSIYENIELYDYKVRQKTIETIVSMYQINDDINLINLIDTIGRKNSFESYISLGRYKEQLELYEQLIIYLNKNHKSIGILRIISYLYPNKENVQLLSAVDRELLNLDKFTDCQHKETAIIVLLAQKQWLEDNLDKVVDYGIDLINYPRIIPRIIMMLEHKLFPENINKKLLQKLYERLPKSNWEYLSKIDKLINEQLANQTSRLVNKNQWNTLGLPEGASSLLPE